MIHAKFPCMLIWSGAAVHNAHAIRRIVDCSRVWVLWLLFVLLSRGVHSACLFGPNLPTKVFHCVRQDELWIYRCDQMESCHMLEIFTSIACYCWLPFTSRFYWLLLFGYSEMGKPMVEENFG